MCEFFSVSRAAYYEWVKKLEEPDPDQERIEPMAIVGLPSIYSKHRVYPSTIKRFCG